MNGTLDKQDYRDVHIWYARYREILLLTIVIILSTIVHNHEASNRGYIDFLHYNCYLRHAPTRSSLFQFHTLSSSSKHNCI
jgi:hypothetical protein